MSIKITPDHRDRQAYVYVRQSTTDQLLHNHESRRRQYALTDRARALGWSEVVIVDDDLGRSGGGVERPGFERLLLAICEARVGIVLAVRPRAWPATAGTGTRYWSSADWWAAYWPMRTGSMTRGCRTIDCCSA
jgi:Resolvase, N terminal domain